MSSWKSLPISTFAKVKGGKRLPKGYTVIDKETGYRYLRVTDMTSGKVDYSQLKYIEPEAYKLISKYTISDKDIFISIAGTVGIVGKIPAILNGINLTENAAKITDIDEGIVNRDYLFYFLRSRFGQNQIKQRTGGSTQPKLAIGRIESITVPIPNLSIQNKIAEILASYDALIENNDERMVYMENIARNVFYEWFVKYKFPSEYQKLNIEENTSNTCSPNDWRLETLDKVAFINPITKPKKTSNISYLPMESLSNDNSIPNLEKLTMRDIPSGSKFKNWDTLFARITPCMENGKTCLVHFLKNDDEVACGSTEFIVLRSRVLSPIYLYFLTRMPDFRNAAQLTMVGASGRQRVHSTFFSNYKVVVPPDILIQQFENRIRNLFVLINTLNFMNQTLLQTQDILLTNLMSGVVEVNI